MGIHIAITETNSGRNYDKEHYKHFTVPTCVPCHNPQCKTGRAFDIRPEIEMMRAKGLLRHTGTAACESPKDARGDCVNFFEYTITIDDQETLAT